MMSTETKVRTLCAEINAPEASRSEALLARFGTDFGRLGLLAGQIAAAQRNTVPRTRIKGLALFATDAGTSRAGSEAVKALLGTQNAIQSLMQQHDIKMAMVDIGLSEDFSQTDWSRQILRQRWYFNELSPKQMAWECVHAGIRVGYTMKGKGTDIFGANCINEWNEPLHTIEEMAAALAWEIGAMAGLILAGANLQTPIVISGSAGASAARIALSLSPLVRDYLIVAQTAGEFGRPVLDLKLPDTLAIITALGMCESASRICASLPSSAPSA